jgi:hypothetical protein
MAEKAAAVGEAEVQRPAPVLPIHDAPPRISRHGL